MRKISPLVVAIALALSLVTACENREQGVPPQVFSGISLTDQHGARLGREALANRVIVLNFMFTSCSSICPRQTLALARVKAALPAVVRERVLFLSVSVDPEHDRPPVLEQFARAHGADVPGWSFALSDEGGTRLLGSRLAAYEPGVEPTPSAHSGAVYLFDRRGRLMQRYHGAPIDTAQLAREIIAVDQLKPSGARVASN